MDNFCSFFYFMENFTLKDDGKVHRYEVPGLNALNFVLEGSLGGGGIASIRPDPLVSTIWPR